MGALISSALDRLAGLGGKKEQRILLLGLDAAGKTTLLYKMALGETTHTVPTVGFNLETVEYKKLSLQMWDVGGQDKLRPLWRHYYRGSHALIYVVDASDKDADRVEMAREELQKMMAAPELADAKLLVYANKQDLPGAMTPSQVAEKMGLSELRDRHWYVQGACALRGDGLHEGLDWLATTLEKHPSK